MAPVNLGLTTHSVSLRLSARSISSGDIRECCPVMNCDISPKGVWLIHVKDVFMLEL
jgi:hypothetical protein